MFRYFDLKRKLNFLLVGGFGFIVDFLTFEAFVQIFGLDIYLARVIAFLIAVIFTWIGNRTLTFSDRDESKNKHQLVKAIACACVSLIPNLGTFFILTLLFEQREMVYVAFCSGVLAGTVSNYLLSDRVVFRSC
ncbi:GtrA family protein [Vibrio sp. 10N.261.55.A7]|uniref:GtrA family protein n=1 Tax=Vibrio sp. 10N.261.55.A7 TaxID=1880851 RepID=UPI000C84712F|nr:GtrA family protein [Vibrio sp. 10N.261.55.A7]PMJ95342.1 hypothetical protein BCU12_00510 [Vibrio sp. 10N.261.55.A7]